MSENLARTPLYDCHRRYGARMVDFAGWEMPVQYRSIVEEHLATRKACGIFDISHMGRLRFDGPGAASFLDRILTRRVIGMPPGAIRYALVTNADGGILDDVLVYHLQAADAEPCHLLVVNAGNRGKIIDWIQRHLTDAADVSFADQTIRTAMIAVQGPAAWEITKPLLDLDPSSLEYYTGWPAVIAQQPAFVSRTGYTGEEGCELIVPAAAATSIFERLVTAARERGGLPAGLGARDTLRLEAAMPLYGHELSESIGPYQAGLGFAVQLKDRDFIGRDAIAREKAVSERPRRVGLSLSGKRVPREHYGVFRGSQRVGEVTSGTFSPTLEQPIAMAYVRADAAAVGTELAVDIRGRQEPARVVPLPFYKRGEN